MVEAKRGERMEQANAQRASARASARERERERFRMRGKRESASEGNGRNASLPIVENHTRCYCRFNCNKEWKRMKNSLAQQNEKMSDGEEWHFFVGDTFIVNYHSSKCA